MKTVFLIQHLHILPGGEEDIKLIGAYRTHMAALAAVARLQVQPGFSNHPYVVTYNEGDEQQGFHISELQLDLDYWPEGYITT